MGTTSLTRSKTVLIARNPPTCSIGPTGARSSPWARASRAGSGPKAASRPAPCWTCAACRASGATCCFSTAPAPSPRSREISIKTPPLAWPGAPTCAPGTGRGRVRGLPPPVVGLVRTARLAGGGKPRTLLHDENYSRTTSSSPPAPRRTTREGAVRVWSSWRQLTTWSAPRTMAGSTSAKVAGVGAPALLADVLTRP